MNKPRVQLLTDAEREAELARWCETLPPETAAVMRRFPPWQKWRIRQTGQTCRIYSINDGPPITFRVLTDPPIPGLVGHDVYGIAPEDLESVDDVPTASD